MENTYGISVDNRYELFYIDDDATDPLEAFAVKKKQQQQQQQNNKTTTTTTKAPANTDQAATRKGSAEKENKSAAINKVNQHQNTTTNARDAVKASAAHPEPAISDKHQAQQQTRDEKGINRRKEAIEKKNRRNREQMDHQQQQSTTIMQNGVGSGGPGGNGGGGGGEEKQRRRRFEGGRGGKREFDRKSGSDKTGVKAVDKREGGGSHNWGSHKQDAIDEMMPKKTARNSNEGNENRAENSSDDAAPNESLEQTPPNPVEEETKELTLDEYKALRAGRSKPPQYNLRKAGEGEDISQWKKMVALEAKRPDGQDDGDNDATSYQQRATRQKHILDIEFHFNDGRRSGQFGRGPRSGRPRVSGGAPGAAGGAGGAPGGGGGGGGVRGPPRNRRNDGDREHRERPRNMDNHRAHYHHHDDHAAAPKVDDEKAFPQLGLMNSSTVRHPVKVGGPAAAAAAAPKLAQIYNKDDVSK